MYICTDAIFNKYYVCRALDVTLNLAKLCNSRKDEDDEPTNRQGVHIGPDAKKTRETVRKEFREGIKENSHQIIGTYYCSSFFTNRVIHVIKIDMNQA